MLRGEGGYVSISQWYYYNFLPVVFFSPFHDTILIHEGDWSDAKTLGFGIRKFRFEFRPHILSNFFHSSEPQFHYLYVEDKICFCFGGVLFKLFFVRLHMPSFCALTWAASTQKPTPVCNCPTSPLRTCSPSQCTSLFILGCCCS